MKTKQVRQGDVFLVRVSVADDRLEAAPADRRGLVLAEGESSGHHHAVFGNGAKLMKYRDSAARVLVVEKGGAELRVIGGGSGGVARHLPVEVGRGKYEVRIQRSWTSEDEAKSRQVAD